MDWSAWLSKSSLHPSLAREYSLLFSDNELEKDDIKYLDHEFLLSMGVSVGKHRLEILKLARKEKGITSAVKKLGKNLSNYVRMVTHRSSSAIVAVPKVVGRQWKTSTVPRSTRLLTAEQGRLMITNGNPAIHYCSKESSGASAEVRWDTMFQDLKPT